MTQPGTGSKTTGSSELAGAIDGICVITIRSQAAPQIATYELLQILSAFTEVSLITVILSEDSPIREEFRLTEISSKGTGWTLFTSITRFIINQIRMCIEIARHDEQVVLFYGPTAYILPVVFSRLIGRTVIIEPRGDVPLTLRLRWEEQVPAILARGAANIVRLLERINYSLADAVISYTPKMAIELGLDPSRDNVYTKGARHIDTDLFGVEIPYSQRNDIVGFVGRLETEKRIPILIDVAKHLAPDIGFVFVGDGTYREIVETELRSEIANGTVEVTGWIGHEEVSEQLNRFKLLVMPSQPTEGLPTTILESFACGTPVYATPVSGIPDVVRPGKTGFLMETVESTTIAEEIKRIIEHEDLELVSTQARDMVEKDFTFDSTVARYEEMFAHIIYTYHMSSG